jgi:uncharacterized membrane protein YccC
VSVAVRVVRNDPHGLHYAVTVFVATTLLWIIVRKFGNADPIWSISSMVATSEPLVKQSLQSFRGRIINTLLGCAVGLVSIALGHSEWQLPFGMASAVLLSSYVVRVQAMWRQAPIAAAIVIAGTLEHHEKLPGLVQGVRRVGEVLLGCVVGITVAWLLSKVWPLPAHTAPKGDSTGKKSAG